MTETAATTTVRPARAVTIDWLALGAALVTVVLWACDGPAADPES